MRGELGSAVNCLLTAAAFIPVKRLNQLEMLRVMVTLVLFQLAVAFFDACVERLDGVTLPATHQRRIALEAI